MDFEDGVKVVQNINRSINIRQNNYKLEMVETELISAGRISCMLSFTHHA